MALLNILHYPDERLHTVARPVDVVDDALRRLIDDMAETMYAADGVGLAAIQIAVPLRIFVVEAQRARAGEREEVHVYINPVVVETSPATETIEEGCLSVDRVPVTIARARRIVVRALDLDGNERTIEAEGFHARVLQHELDHLDGRTVFDHAGPVKRQLIKKRMAARKR